MATHYRITIPDKQTGFNMVEVMVTLAILSVGLLGLAGLQSIGLRLNQQSYQRTQAVIQTYDLIDRIRANWKCAGDDACEYSNVALGEIPTSPPNCISSDGTAICSATQMATYDVAEWNSTNAKLLTRGRGAVCRGAISGTGLTCTPAATGLNTYWIAITWVENDLEMRLDTLVEPRRPEEL